MGHPIIPCLHLQVCTVKAMISASWDFQGLAKILYKRGCEAEETVQVTIGDWSFKGLQMTGFCH